MGTSSILGGTPAPSQAEGRDTDALGPSDSSDSGSDIQGERLAATESDDGDFMHATPSVQDSDAKLPVPPVMGVTPAQAAAPAGTVPPLLAMFSPTVALAPDARARPSETRARTV